MFIVQNGQAFTYHAHFTVYRLHISTQTVRITRDLLIIRTSVTCIIERQKKSRNEEAVKFNIFAQ